MGGWEKLNQCWAKIICELPYQQQSEEKRQCEELLKQDQFKVKQLGSINYQADEPGKQGKENKAAGSQPEKVKLEKVILIAGFLVFILKIAFKNKFRLI